MATVASTTNQTVKSVWRKHHSRGESVLGRRDRGGAPRQLAASAVKQALRNKGRVSPL